MGVGRWIGQGEKSIIAKRNVLAAKQSKESLHTGKKAMASRRLATPWSGGFIKQTSTNGSEFSYHQIKVKKYVRN